MAKQLLLGLLLVSTTLAGQDDKTSPIQRIAATRRELINAFRNDDPAEAALWRDSLTRLESDRQVALVWDERWLLYFWEESYGNLFDEATRFDAAERQRQADKTAPPKDSLFELLDQTLFESRFSIYDKISKGFLTEEEKQFALIELDYLLRLNQAEIKNGEWNKRLDAFIALHPNSRFEPYIRANLYGPEVKQKASGGKRKDQGGSLDFLFTSGRWRDQLERNLRSPYGFEIGLAYWTGRWNFGLRCNFSWQKIERSIFENNYEWPKGDATSLILPAFEVGYDIIRGPKVRVFPSAVAGISILKPPGVDEEEEEPLPDYYSDFFFARGYLGAALTTDIKLKHGDDSDWSYIGARLRVGYNWLNWRNPYLHGDMFYFSVGVNLFGHSDE